MKFSNLSKFAGSGLLALSLAFVVSALPASAQNNSDPNSNPDRTTLDTTPLQESENDNNHWGALGLLGLIGLANLFRKDDEVVHHR